MLTCGPVWHHWRRRRWARMPAARPRPERATGHLSGLERRMGAGGKAVRRGVHWVGVARVRVGVVPTGIGASELVAMVVQVGVLLAHLGPVQMRVLAPNRPVAMGLVAQILLLLLRWRMLVLVLVLMLMLVLVLRATVIGWRRWWRLIKLLVAGRDCRLGGGEI